MKEVEQTTSTRRRGGGGANAANGDGTGWNDTWRFTVKKTAEAKGVIVEDKWRKDGAGPPASPEEDDESSDSD
jgi:hypothetical protein